MFTILNTLFARFAVYVCILFCFFPRQNRRSLVTLHDTNSACKYTRCTQRMHGFVFVCVCVHAHVFSCLSCVRTRVFLLVVRTRACVPACRAYASVCCLVVRTRACVPACRAYACDQLLLRKLLQRYLEMQCKFIHILNCNWDYQNLIEQTICGLVKDNKNVLSAWAPAEIFPEGGKLTDTIKSRHVFGAPYKKSTIFQRAEGANEMFCVFSRRFRLKHRVSSAS